jgi:ribonuclease E
MSRLMLIDAGHPEETRVAVVNGEVVEDFDFESQNKRQLRGNIYLAKVTRVEPSLQAAFIEYGGNRHGFLAFGEIHPDYYQIPVEDREQLLRDVAEEAASASSDDDDDEGLDDEDIRAEAARRAARLAKKYPIQSVLRRRQIMLVQVVKEERGNKGAALTTYLSLAGRYCVLMPNTARGGGISRKIANPADRKRLKKIVQELEVPQGMGLIIRTAGAKRTKAEIKRDYDYLLRMFENVRERTLKSVAPALIHEEGGLVHRAVRDLYDKDIEQIVVQGEDAYKEAKEYVRLLMPSHARRVVQHKSVSPVFVEHGVEGQLDTVLTPTVQLRSGGYIVINQTEALVAIDVNSGKSTRERNIEATALKTNLEAADEACRQMRLRDLAGLIVIDFIDMEDQKNVRSVERRMRDALKSDRARVQVGKISGFGLLEISRQRRRSGVLDSSSDLCAHCGGTGRTRSLHSTALHALRSTETYLGETEATLVQVETPLDVAMYLLNSKRDTLRDIEERAGARIHVLARTDLRPGEVRVGRGSDPSLDEEDAEAERASGEGHRRGGRDRDREREGDRPRDRYRDGERSNDRGGDRGRGPRREAAEYRRPMPEPIEADPEEVEEEEDLAETSEREEDGNGRRRRRRGRRGGLKRRGDGEVLGVIELDGAEEGPVGDALQPRSQRQRNEGHRSDGQRHEGRRDDRRRDGGRPQGDRHEGRRDGRPEQGRSQESRSERNDAERGRRNRRRGGRDRGSLFRPTDGGELLDGFAYDVARTAILDASRERFQPEPEAVIEVEAVAPVEAVEAAPLAEVAAPKPRRTRRPKAEAAPAVDADVVTEGVAEPVAAEPVLVTVEAPPAPEPAPEPVEPPPIAGEIRVEGGTPAQPRRFGWWAAKKKPEA